MGNMTTAQFEALMKARGLPPLDPPKPKRPTRLASGHRSKLEADYDRHLAFLRAAGEVVLYAYETLTVKLGDDCRITPDFLVRYADGSLALEDTKGWSREDATVKLKWLACAVAPLGWTVWIVRRVKGEWVREHIKPAMPAQRPPAGGEER